MALIGEMKYLTIGGNTYSIPEPDLPIASSSTLGGIKVGSGLTIDSSTGVLTATGTSITIDTAMSDSSTNTVQNKVIKSYVDTNIPTKVSDLQNDSGFTTNTGTVTSVGAQNATNGGLTISGSPVTSSGSITVGHTNVLTSAQTTQAVYPIKIDKNGHISAYGSAVSIPTKTSDLTNDSGFITTETDPTVPSWAKADNKPSYTASEVGLGNVSNNSNLNSTTGAKGDIIYWSAANTPAHLTNTSSATKKFLSITSQVPSWTTLSNSDVGLGNVDNVKQYSASNPPPYPVTSVNGSTGAVSLSIPTKTSDLTNDSGFITDAGVTSFNGDTGAITYTAPVTSVNGNTGAVTISVPTASSTTPAMDGTAAVGSETTFARGDHVHPTDTSRAATTAVTTQASIGSDGLITYKNSGNTSLYTVQLPLFDGSSGASSLNYLPLGGGSLTGNLSVGGTLGVTGATSISTLTTTGKITGGNGLEITGATTIQGNLSVNGIITSTGLLTASNGISTTTLTTSGNSTIGGTLGVTGATTLSSTLGVTGNTTIGSNLIVNGTISGQGFADLLFGVGNVISSNSSCDTLLAPGKYSCQNSTVAATLTNPPFTACGFGLFVIKVSTLTNYLEQIAISNATSIMIKMRYYNNDTWTAWKSITPQ